MRRTAGENPLLGVFGKLVIHVGCTMRTELLRLKAAGGRDLALRPLAQDDCARSG
jgi:hypothetical protein